MSKGWASRSDPRKVGRAKEAGTHVEAQTEQKWGFLKNIVNIDRFFDSGVKA